MAPRPDPERRSERGAVLIQTAISILVLVGFLTFVLDYGVMWLSRGQAQNAADAGAISGAIARAFDNAPPVGGGVAETSAIVAAQANEVWNAAPVVQISWACPTGVTGSCVRADVYRNGQFGSTSPPQVFGSVLGIGGSSQGVRATATAVVAIGNTTNCMRPFSVSDKWVENILSPNSDAYDHWDSVGGTAVELAEPDSYTPTGYAVPGDIGVEVTLKGGNPSSSNDPITSGWYLPVRLPDGNGGYFSGANDYSNAIKFCIGNPVSIGDYLPLESGVMTGPTNQGVETDDDSLIEQDPYATFNTTTKMVENSCAPMCGPFSPRIVPISVFDIEDFNHRRASGDWTVCPGGGKCIKVVNILGFFVDHLGPGGDVIGYLIMLPGEFITGSPSVGESNAFLRKIQLVR